MQTSRWTKPLRGPGRGHARYGGSDVADTIVGDRGRYARATMEAQVRVIAVSALTVLGMQKFAGRSHPGPAPSAPVWHRVDCTSALMKAVPAATPAGGALPTHRHRKQDS